MMALLFIVLVAAVAAAGSGRERTAEVFIFVGALLGIAMLLYHATTPLSTVL
jgi:Family of unknown function (DUF5993)